jgi:hypothetical protein
MPYFAFQSSNGLRSADIFKYLTKEGREIYCNFVVKMKGEEETLESLYKRMKDSDEWIFIGIVEDYVLSFYSTSVQFEYKERRIYK